MKPTPQVNRSSAESVGELTLQALFDAEEAPLLRYAFSLVGRRAVAEEIVQDVFMRLHAQWDDVQAPRAWLFRSVRNGAFKHLRDNKREVFHAAKDSRDGGDMPTDEETQRPEVALAHMEAVGALRQMLDELDETDRRLVKLKYFGDMKYRDISKETGLSVGNVGYRLHHILKELAGKLRNLGFDDRYE